jgi:hypothetical protein
MEIPVEAPFACDLIIESAIILSRSITSIGEVVGAFLRREAVEECTDLSPGGFNGAGVGLAQQGFEL